MEETGMIGQRSGMGIEETLSIYQIFLRNYTEQGTFNAAVARLDEVRALGFGWVYLTPIHPVGKNARKGTAGSPYAIADYRLVDPELGTLADFRSFAAAVHDRGMKLMIDVVYNHTAPDSALARAHPDWFIRSAGRPGRKCQDWSDVVDFDFASSPALREELIDTLVQWALEGVDGFRCDVASLVPVDFWLEARRRVNDTDPASGNERRATLWLAESVHPEFLLSMRDRGFGAWSEGELHSAFDLTYDYDGWERLERFWTGEASLRAYMDHLAVQRAACPASARKIRYLENHDQRRAADRFGRGDRLRAWTAFYQLLPGCSFAYMGQESAIERRPSLFEKDPVPWSSGDADFRKFFASCFSATQSVKRDSPSFSWTMPAEGVASIRRSGISRNYRFIANLDSRNGKLDLGGEIAGTDVMTGKRVRLAGRTELPRDFLLVEED